MAGGKAGGKAAKKGAKATGQQRAVHALDVIVLLDVMAWMQKGRCPWPYLPRSHTSRDTSNNVLRGGLNFAFNLAKN